MIDYAPIISTFTQINKNSLHEKITIVFFAAFFGQSHFVFLREQ